MSTSNYKSSLTPGGPTFAEKAKLQMRRPTPDSDAVASSDDDHDHVPQTARPAPANVYPGGRRPSSGWLQDIQPNRKFSLPSVSFAGVASNPTTPSLELPQQARPSTSSFPWNTSSFTSAQSGTRLKEVLPSPTSIQAPGDRALPSPTTEADDGIGFLLNQQNPIRKSVRSQSYSIGQADIENSPVGQFSSRIRTSLRHRPSKPSLLGEGLTQLREDDNDEIESSNGSEAGVRLPVGYWEREQKQALLKQAAEHNARARHRAASTASPNASQHPEHPTGAAMLSRRDSDFAIDELDDHEQAMGAANLALVRRFSEHAGNSAFAGPSHAPHLGDHLAGNPWAAPVNNLNVDNLGRRHSFATYSSHNQVFNPPTFSYNEEEELMSPLEQAEDPENQEPFDASAYFTGYGPASRAINASAISAAHPDPIAHHTTTTAPANPYAVPPVLGRPGRRLFVVTFKCSRADIYYLYDNTGLEIRAGDLVITEGDRGCDLGQVSHADVSLEDAKKFKTEALDEHFRWLVMFSQYSLAGAKEVGMLGALARANGFPNMNRATLTSMGGQQDQDTKPKIIKRLAQQHEIAALRDKEGQEAKAKRLGAQKAVEHKLPMEILDAEFQADYHKLTFFYYADAYVNFNPLVTDIFKQYKIRIWMSAVNPASVVNPAGIMQIQPPSAIGPGAIIHPRTSNAPAVGPGFGASTYRQHDQRGGRGNPATTHSQYDEAFYPFAHQFGNYANQQQFGVQGYGQFNPHDLYGRYSPYHVPGYPGVSSSGSPMNYNAYYPPSSFSDAQAFSSASTGPSYRGGYLPTTSGPAGYSHAYSNASDAGPAYSTAGYGSQAAFDTALLSAMQGMSFGSN